MGRSGSLTHTKSTSKTQDCEILQLGMVEKILSDRVAINLFSAQNLSLPSKCCLESFCVNELVQILTPSSASLSEDRVVMKLEKPIFGTIERISNKTVRISVDGVSHKKRLLTLPKGFVDGFLGGNTMPHAKIKIVRGGKKGGLYIGYVD